MAGAEPDERSLSAYDNWRDIPHKSPQSDSLNSIRTVHGQVLNWIRSFFLQKHQVQTWTMQPPLVKPTAVIAGHHYNERFWTTASTKENI